MPPKDFLRPRISRSGFVGSIVLRCSGASALLTPPRVGTAVCWACVSAVTAARSGMRPSLRKRIIKTRIMPKISSIDCTRSSFWKNPMPVKLPKAWIHCVRSCRNQDCRRCKGQGAEPDASDLAIATDHDHDDNHDLDREGENPGRAVLTLPAKEGTVGAPEAR